MQKQEFDIVKRIAEIRDNPDYKRDRDYVRDSIFVLLNLDPIPKDITLDYDTEIEVTTYKDTLFFGLIPNNRDVLQFTVYSHPSLNVSDSGVVRKWINSVNSKKSGYKLILTKPHNEMVNTIGIPLESIKNNNIYPTYLDFVAKYKQRNDEINSLELQLSTIKQKIQNYGKDRCLPDSLLEGIDRLIYDLNQGIFHPFRLFYIDQLPTPLNIILDLLSYIIENIPDNYYAYYYSYERERSDERKGEQIKSFHTLFKSVLSSFSDSILINETTYSDVYILILNFVAEQPPNFKISFLEEITSKCQERTISVQPSCNSPKLLLEIMVKSLMAASNRHFYGSFNFTLYYSIINNTDSYDNINQTITRHRLFEGRESYSKNEFIKDIRYYSRETILEDSVKRYAELLENCGVLESDPETVRLGGKMKTKRKVHKKK